MSLKHRNLLTKPSNIILGLFCIAFIGAILFTFSNGNLYNKPIGQIIDVKHVSLIPTKDAQNNRDIKYKNQLKVKTLNGQSAGETTTINHQCVKSQADSEASRTREKVLLHISNKPSDAHIIEKKRDTLTIIITGLFLLTILLVGRKAGLQSILSLILNSITILIAIYIHIQYSNINLFLFMTTAMICSTTLTSLLVISWYMRTLITIASTTIGTFLSVGLTELIIYMTDGKGIKYETMNFLSLPPKDILLASVLIGSLGVIMDVAITIAGGMCEVLQRAPHISVRRWVLAGRNIGQDIMGTVTNILLLSYLSGALPIFLIFLENANTVTYTISMNWSLKIARVLTGGIGIVLTIPVIILFMGISEALRRAKQ